MAAKKPHMPVPRPRSKGPKRNKSLTIIELHELDIVIKKYVKKKPR